MKIVTVVGARPQFVKAAVVSRIFAKHNEIKEVIVHTGQHFDVNMSDVFFEEMCIPKPDHNLNINGLGHGAMTGQMLEKLEAIFVQEQPDWVLVYGDTNSTIAGALAAKKLGIKVAHVEAGLRSFNMKMPEEINRILTDRISDVLFCPTQHAVTNLLNEGYKNLNVKVEVNGDVMQDAAIFYSALAIPPNDDLPGHFVLCTVHRAENTDDVTRLKSIFTALERISQQVKVVLPLHPRTKNKLKDINYNFKKSQICFIDPVGYLQMVYLLKNCEMVLTDSGGLQKEAYFFEKKCITLRDETEWVELVENGFNQLTGADSESILNAYSCMMSKTATDFSIKLYGDGDAGEMIAETLLNWK